MLVKRVIVEEKVVGGAAAVFWGSLLDEATHCELEEKNHRSERSPSEITALPHGPRGCWRFDGV